MSNPLFSLNFEPSIENLGECYWDVVEAADFPISKLRFRNNNLLKQLGIEPNSIKNKHLEEAFGQFKARAPLLALRYHGYQFGTYNPFLGDGRGFLYGQIRDQEGKLQDLGTKGSGTTPWSRGGDGRLTLKGGVREVIASEALHRLGVKTSRTLSLIETGEDLWRGDEPSPTRSSVMVRVAQTHLRFGNCERLRYLNEPKSLERLLRHVVAIYYPHIAKAHPIQSENASYEIETQLLAFYSDLVSRVAELAAEWMSAGFTHGVLNTDNMSLVGESFDYGPFAFINRWEPNFTAAYFDDVGLYAFGRQPVVCQNNLRLLQDPLAMLLAREPMEESLDKFFPTYVDHYRFCLMRRLGLPAKLKDAEEKNISLDIDDTDLVRNSLELLANWQIEYAAFFEGLTKQVIRNGLPNNPDELEPISNGAPPPPRKQWLEWRDSWWAHQNAAISIDPLEMHAIPARLQRWNLPKTPIRGLIEDLWKEIDQQDNWGPLISWLNDVQLE